MAKTKKPLILSDDGRHPDWRTPLLNATSKVLAIIGSIWFAVNIAINPEVTLSPRRIIAASVLGLIWVTAIFKRLPENVRLGAILSGFISIATINIINSGPAAPGVVLPSMLVLLLAMLYGGLRGALIAGITILVLNLIGAYGWVTGTFPLRSTVVNNDLLNVFVWIRTEMGILFVFSAIIAIVNYLMKHVQVTMEELRNSEERAHLQISYAPEAIVVLDIEHMRFTEANPAAERLFGYSRAELLTKSPMDVSPERQSDGRLTDEVAAAAIQKAIQGSEVTFSWLHRNAHGKIIPCEIRLLRLPSDGHILLRGTVIDISERLHADQLRERSLSLMNATLESTADGILVVDVAGKIEIFNRMFTRMWRLPEDILQSKDDARALQWVLDQLSNPQQFMDKVKHLYDHPLEESFDILNFKDSRVFERFSRPQIIADKVVGRVWSFRDVTEQRRIAETNATLRAQLLESQKMEAIGTLAGGIAHDFNNILTGILGYTMLAKQVSGNSAELDEYLDQVSKGGKRAAELVSQILTFSRRGNHKSEPVQLRDVVTEAIKLLRATIPASIKIDAELPSNMPRVLANATQLHQVVMNLGSNAYHAMRDRLGTLTVRLETRLVDAVQTKTLSGINPGKYVCLIVGDTGVGMDEATLDRVFEPFFTTKLQGEGTGLGLSVVHGIILGYHGTIHVSSEPGRGSRFEILLPAIIEDHDTCAADADVVQRGHGEHILFVDDEETLVSLGKRMLEALGYEVQVETQVLQALARVKRDPNLFQMIITDHSMPRMTGLDFAERIRDIRADLPIILVSGYSASLTNERINSSGIREVLQKPYSDIELAAVIQRHLQKGQTD